MVTNKQHDIINVGSTVKKSVSKRRGTRRQQVLKEVNDDNDHSIMEDFSLAKKQNASNRNKIMQSH